MSKPLTMSIPHQLGREEAKRRLESGLRTLKDRFAGTIGGVQETWTGDHCDFSFKALGQSIGGGLDVAEDHVMVEVQLPWILAAIGETAKKYIEKEGTLLLEKKK